MKNKHILMDYFHKGITYSTYMKEMEKKTKNKNLSLLSEEELGITALNLYRTQRIHKTYQVTEELKKLLLSVSSVQCWLVLSEHWCGDSAQSLPYIAKMAECNQNIQFRILYRDQHVELMDQYLTNNTRSIPKLIAFSEDGMELFSWGPRPRKAASLFIREKKAGLKKEEILHKLHLWYGRDRGKTIEKEFIELLSKNHG